MNLYEVMNDKEIKLLENSEIKIEDKNYVQEDFHKMEQQIVEYIMSASSKNGDIDNRRNEYESILRKIIIK